MQALLQSIPSMILIIFLGWFTRRIGFLDERDVNLLNKIIIYLALPALIFLAVRQSQLSLSLVKIPFLAILVMALCLGVAYLVGRLSNYAPKTFGSFLIASSMGNTG
ncbi:MAG: AEC family transporter, partial [Actinomycetota bacterium]